jgi:hypothetical protein
VSYESYFREMVQPMLSTEGVEFIGEISEKDKDHFCARPLPCCFRSAGRNRLASS